MSKAPETPARVPAHVPLRRTGDPLPATLQPRVTYSLGALFGAAGMLIMTLVGFPVLLGEVWGPVATLVMGVVGCLLFCSWSPFRLRSARVER